MNGLPKGRREHVESASLSGWCDHPGHHGLACSAHAGEPFCNQSAPTSAPPRRSQNSPQADA
eukprot:7125241-Prorocentrum_lima.AAC.1